MTIRQITLLFVAIATPMIAMDRDHSGKKVQNRVQTMFVVREGYK